MTWDEWVLLVESVRHQLQAIGVAALPVVLLVGGILFWIKWRDQ